MNRNCSGTVSVAGRRDTLAAPWDQRFFWSTRGRIVTLLRRSGRTVEGLAGELGLTDNGVQAHLATTLERGAYLIQGYSCPLAALTPEHPEVCRMAETLLTEVAGVSVYERCDRGERPRCCFEVANPQAAEGE
jgi:predicted ArsR family transcriptional regulator